MREAGTAAVESSLCLIVLLLFLLMSPAIWRIWIGEHRARAEAERKTFRATSCFMDLNSYQVMIDQAMAMDLDAFLHPPKSADIPNLSPTPPNNLKKYKDFPNKVVIGLDQQHVVFGSGWKSFQGEMDFRRYAYTNRPTWTWNGYPFVPTQDQNEFSSIKSWANEAYKATLTKTVTDGLKLTVDPFSN